MKIRFDRAEKVEFTDASGNTVVLHNVFGGIEVPALVFRSL